MSPQRGATAPEAPVSTMPFSRALNAGLRAALAADDHVLLMGEDIWRLGGVFRVFVFAASGVALALGQRAGLWLCVAGLLSFVALVLRALIMLLLSPTPAEKIP